MFIAHPSHELRLHGWLQKAGPRVSVMTDGSGRSGNSSLASTTRVLNKVGAEQGTVYGRLTDRELYCALLNRDVDLFIGFADALAAEFSDARIEYVVGDAEEGYSSAHDMCRYVLNAAVALANRRQKRPIVNYDFLVVQSHDISELGASEDCHWLELDEQTYSRKLAAVQAYDARLAADILAALNGEKFQGIKHFSEPRFEGMTDLEVSNSALAAVNNSPPLLTKMKNVFGAVELEALRFECLRPVTAQPPGDGRSDEPRFYELYADQLVAAGRYERAIRYREHLVPIIDGLTRHVERSR